VANTPFSRAPQVGKPGPTHQLVVDHTSALSAGLRTVLLFEESRLTDIALPSRLVTRRGSVVVQRGAHGGQAHSGVTGTTGTAATPGLVLNPKDASTAAFTVSALVRFDGANPSFGSFNVQGVGLVADDSGRMPIYVSAVAGTFRTHVPAELAFLSAGSPLLASSLTGWHRLTVTVSGSTATLYVDGGTTFIGTAAQGFAAFTLRSVLGSDVSTGFEWQWPVADLFYWTQALTADQVSGHALRPYTSVLKSKMAERWVAAVLPSAAVALPGNTWDDPFDDTFGPAIGFGVLVQLAASASFSAAAGIVKAASAEIDGAGFPHFSAVIAPVGQTTATLGGSGGLIALAGSTGVFSEADGAGALSANAQLTRAASSQRLGLGTIITDPATRQSVRAAMQGSASFRADGQLLEPFNRAHALFSGAGSLRADALLTHASGRLAVLRGAGSFRANSVRIPANHSYMMGHGKVLARASVRRRPRPRPGMAAGSEPDIVVIEVETYKGGNVPITATFGHGVRPHGTLSRTPPTLLANTTKILASDIGYRTAPTDQGGPIAYPPLLTDAYQIDVGMTLDPSRTSAAAAWGSILLANPNGQFDPIIGVQNSDGRPVNILTGRTTWDSTRQYLTDPRYSDLTVLFSGLASPWSLTDDGLSIPLRDATYFLEKPLQNDLYGGTGGLDGTPDLAGKPKPMARGGASAGRPIQNVTPVLIDPTNRIYQYNDNPGRVEFLYENAFAHTASGDGALQSAGDTTNLYAGITPIGMYRTDNSRGLFQLGSVPVGQITCDVVGNFTRAGQISSIFAVCSALLTEEMALPDTMIDAESFVAADQTLSGYFSGVYFSSDENWTCVQAIDSILASVGANLIPTRDGRLRVVLLRAITNEPVVASYDASQIIFLARRPLPSTVDPPPYRFKVGYNHNYTINSTISPLATATRQQFVRSADRYATWYDPAVLQAYRRPNDFQPMPGPLLTLNAAQDAANQLGALWGTPRRLYDVTLPRRMFGREIGDVVHITYPIEQLTGGQNARVVGYSLRAADATVTYTVLV